MAGVEEFQHRRAGMVVGAVVDQFEAAARPRRRLELVDDSTYNHARAAVLEFLYARHRAPGLAA